MNKIVKGLMIAGILGASLMAFTRTADAKDKDGNIVIVIDPGHGGEDPGSLATTGATESKCNYAIAEVMKKELSKYDGVKVYLTREEDTWMTARNKWLLAHPDSSEAKTGAHIGLTGKNIDITEN